LRERLALLYKLGSGSCGTIFKAIDFLNFQPLAVKFIHVTNKNKRKQLVQELIALHDIPQNTGSSVDDDGSNQILGFIDAFSNIQDETVGLVVEYMDYGSLQNLVDAGGIADERVLANISKQCLLGLRFLHGKNQIHYFN